MVRIEDKAEYCSADDSEPNRNTIEEDMVQDVDKNESDYRAT